MSTPETTQQIDERVADRFQLKALVEACLVVEEGIPVPIIIPARSRVPTSAGSTTCWPRSSGPSRSGARDSSRR
jgi:hypothetical protein